MPRRIGSPDDIAASLRFLASPARFHITGQPIVAVGGETVS
jgi:NAD(P)-dependent dehydrogenase (short-subunit alcohol dehydrogenase family)